LAVAALVAALPALADEPATPKSVTVFPIILNTGGPIPGVEPDMVKNITELVGLFLERGGVKDVEISDARFLPPADADLAKLSEAFSRFVAAQKVSTDYTLFGQIFGSPPKGAEEIRLVATDRQGKVVFSERLDRQQLGAEKVGPMIASYRLVYRLEKVWGLADPDRKDAPVGKMAMLWREKSGMPPQDEQDAMRPRLDALKKTIKSATIAVFPVGDAQLTARLAEMLTNAGLGHAEAVNTDPKLDIKPSTNQTRIGWDTARAFREFLRKNPPTADYALLASYGIGRNSEGKTEVGGIGLIVCDRKGDWVISTGRNSFQSDFRQINPQSADDCNRLVVEVLKGELR
jgi:hypothetical protein